MSFAAGQCQYVSILAMLVWDSTETEGTLIRSKRLLALTRMGFKPLTPKEETNEGNEHLAPLKKTKAAKAGNSDAVLSLSQFEADLSIFPGEEGEETWLGGRHCRPGTGQPLSMEGREALCPCNFQLRLCSHYSIIQHL